MIQKFKYIGSTEMHGEIYEKGKVQLVFYKNGLIKYWPDFHGDYKRLFYRNSNGMMDANGLHFPEAKKHINH